VRERLQKILASAGIASRRRAEALIAGGDVMVNGAVAVLGQSADLDVDSIVVRGRPLAAPRARYVALHKPAGYVTTLRGHGGEPTVLHLLDLPERVYPVGRLDRDSGGLLLLTNDGDWANLIAHPRYGIEKEYEVLVRGNPSLPVVAHLERGVRLETGAVTAPARVRRLGSGDGTTRLSLTLTEGKKRQIRLMCAAVGHPVVRLTRVRIGPIRLGRLPVGHVRDLTEQEVESIRERARRKSGSVRRTT